MDTQWFLDALAERRLSQRGLAKLLGCDPASINRLIHGARPLRFDEASKIAALLGVPVADVIAHAGVQISEGGRTVPVVGYVDAAGEAHLDWAGDAERTPAPIDLPPHSVAVQFRGGEHYDGWMLFLTPPTGVDPESIGRVSLVCISQTGMVLLRRPRRGYRLGTHNLDGPTTQPIENANLEWATPVRWIRP